MDGRRIRLCMKDLYHQDVVEMIERETRPFAMWSIDSPDHPDFQQAFDMLWEQFGEHGEMEPLDAVKGFLREDTLAPEKSGTYMRYFLFAAKDRHGNMLGVRDGTILVNPKYAPDLCVVYLSHIYMRPEARGTVLSYWLRISPVEIAMQYLMELHLAGRITLPRPDQPGRNFGMRMNLTAEMEYFAPEDRLSLQRILFYGRGGFDVINPRHFPYRQPDYRDPDEIAKTQNTPLPFMILLRRMGRERQARIPIEEAEATMNLLYDDFASFCKPEYLENSLDEVMDKLERLRQRGREWVELLPLPSGPNDLNRLKPLWRYAVFNRTYKGDIVADEYVARMRPIVGRSQKWLDAQLAELSATLERRTHYVYESRERGYTWDGHKVKEDNPDLLDAHDLSALGGPMSRSVADGAEDVPLLSGGAQDSEDDTEGEPEDPF